MESWKLVYKGYNPGEEKLREALCCLGNGYFTTRGAMEGVPADEHHYPGTYLAGGYNRLESEISGKIIENEDLVNWPDWTVLRFKPENGEWFHPDQVEILEYEQVLDLKEGLLSRKIRFKDDKQRESELLSNRLICMGNRHIAAIEWKLTPINWSGKIKVHSALDASVTNKGVKRYSELNGKHLKLIAKGKFEEDGIFIKVMTNQSEIVMAQAARTNLCFDSYDTPIERTTVEKEEYIAQELEFVAQENKSIIVEKIVSIYTSKDFAISEPVFEAKKDVRRIPHFLALKNRHRPVWEDLWKQSDVNLVADEVEDQLLLRLHIFHLMQTYSHNSIDTDAGIPARGWHGEAYRGHIFWDELFILPLFTIRAPELTRSLLMYRYRRLGEARVAAAREGYKGAMFPWQSGSNGREESQVIHLNPQSGRWIPDNTYLQRHINSAVAYNIWQYFETTGDLEFLSFYGAEVLIEIAKFWASKATYNEERQRYEIHKVVGPDEYHTSLPGSEEPGLKNNAYTNLMVVWSLIHALKALERLDAQRRESLMLQLEIDKEDTDRWENISRKMFIPLVEDNKIIEQYEGFHQLQDLDWEKYHNQYGDILRLDRILEKEGDQVNRYKAVKQADVIMLFYLFSAEELTDLFTRLGYDFDPAQQIPMNINYYQDITAHGSTLSKLVDSWVYARSRRDKSWHDFKSALFSDFKDVQGGTTPEGIHLGAMAGTIDLIQRCYTGLEFKKDALHFNPQLPENVKNVKFRLRYLNYWLQIELTPNKLQLISQGDWDGGININVKDKAFTLKKGEEKTIEF
ncbi:glycoside hydrolase family 65 protein [Salegentibacter chungangensis]|uniref:Glycoside hydrolase family 65 protein n=1 Tax=Salegentibacter chungangensis TaxID=1335724 RepID=A0ABW3NRA2_9FLAO